MVERGREHLRVLADVHEPGLQRRPCGEHGADQKDRRTAVQALWTATEKRARTAAFQTSAHPIVGRSARSAKRGPTTLPVTMPAPKTQITKGTACGNAGDMDEGRRDVAEDGEHAAEADRRDRQRQPDLRLLQRAEFA